MPGPLFIFLDESGNLDFSPKGTKYWSLTALCTFDPVAGRAAFSTLHYELAAGGSGIECFHATEDKQAVRDRVFETIMGLKDAAEIHSVIAEKKKAHPTLYRQRREIKGKQRIVADETRFYNLICHTLLKYIMAAPAYSEATSFVIILSSIFTKEKQSQIQGALKSALKTHAAKPFHIYFRPNKADINCQIADYCGWAISIAWERNERRPLNTIRSIVKSEFDLFRQGRTFFY